MAEEVEWELKQELKEEINDFSTEELERVANVTAEEVENKIVVKVEQNEVDFETVKEVQWARTEMCQLSDQVEEVKQHVDYRTVKEFKFGTVEKMKDMDNRTAEKVKWSKNDMNFESDGWSGLGCNQPGTGISGKGHPMFGCKEEAFPECSDSVDAQAIKPSAKSDHLSKMESYICHFSLCSYTALTRSALLNHYTKVHGCCKNDISQLSQSQPTLLPFHCMIPNCKESFTHSSGHRSHYRLCHNIDGIQLEKLYREHLNALAPSPGVKVIRLYKCNIIKCRKYFTQLYKLIRHYSRKHSMTVDEVRDNILTKCCNQPHCVASFTHLSDLQRHLQCEHGSNVESPTNNLNVRDYPECSASLDETKGFGNTRNQRLLVNAFKRSKGQQQLQHGESIPLLQDSSSRFSTTIFDVNRSGTEMVNCLSNVPGLLKSTVNTQDQGRAQKTIKQVDKMLLEEFYSPCTAESRQGHLRKLPHQMNSTPATTMGVGTTIATSDLLKSSESTAHVASAVPRKEQSSKSEQAELITPCWLQQKILVPLPTVLDKPPLGIMMQSYNCIVSGCMKSFTQLYRLIQHYSYSHRMTLEEVQDIIPKGYISEFLCSQSNCPASFIHFSDLRRHLQSQHGINIETPKRKPHACNYPGCSASFSLDLDLKAHTKQKHLTCNDSAHLTDLDKRCQGFKCEESGTMDETERLGNAGYQCSLENAFKASNGQQKLEHNGGHVFVEGELELSGIISNHGESIPILQDSSSSFSTTTTFDVSGSGTETMNFLSNVPGFSKSTVGTQDQDRAQVTIKQVNKMLVEEFSSSCTAVEMSNPKSRQHQRRKLPDQTNYTPATTMGAGVTKTTSDLPESSESTAHVASAVPGEAKSSRSEQVGNITPCLSQQNILVPPATFLDELRCGKMVRPFNCNFSGCRKSFTKLYKLIQHYSYSHRMTLEEVQDIVPKGYISEFHCCQSNCPASFIHFSDLRRHLQSQHGINIETPKRKAHKCSYLGCSASFNLAIDLKAHTKQKHLACNGSAHLTDLDKRCQRLECEASGAMDETERLGNVGYQCSLENTLKASNGQQQLEHSGGHVFVEGELELSGIIRNCGEFISLPQCSSFSTTTTFDVMNGSGTETNVPGFSKSTVSNQAQGRAEVTIKQVDNMLVDHFYSPCTAEAVFDPKSRQDHLRKPPDQTNAAAATPMAAGMTITTSDLLKSSESTTHLASAVLGEGEASQSEQAGTITPCLLQRNILVQPPTILGESPSAILKQPYNCNLSGCGTSFMELYKLIQHYSYSHHMTLEEVQDIIPKGYISEFQCGQSNCPASFIHFSDLRRHLQSQHGINIETPKRKAHKCSYLGCSASFNLAIDLKAHTKQKHLACNGSAHLTDLDKRCQRLECEGSGAMNETERLGNVGYQCSLENTLKASNGQQQLEHSGGHVFVEGELELTGIIRNCGELISLPQCSSFSTTTTFDVVNGSGTETNVPGFSKSTVSTQAQGRAEVTIKQVDKMLVDHFYSPCTAEAVFDPKSRQDHLRKPPDQTHAAAATPMAAGMTITTLDLLKSSESTTHLASAVPGEGEASQSEQAGTITPCLLQRNILVPPPSILGESPSAILKQPYNCNLSGCGTSFMELYKLIQHYSYSHHMTLEEVQDIIPKGYISEFQCGQSNCPASFIHFSDLRRHLQSQHGINIETPKRKPHACNYPGCSASFNLAIGLKADTKQKHLNCNDSAHLADLNKRCQGLTCEGSGTMDETEGHGNISVQCSLENQFKASNGQQQLQHSDGHVLVERKGEQAGIIRNFGELISFPQDSSSSFLTITVFDTMNRSGPETNLLSNVSGFSKSTVGNENQVTALAIAKHVPSRRVDKRSYFENVSAADPKRRRGCPKKLPDQMDAMLAITTGAGMTDVSSDPLESSRSNAQVASAMRDDAAKKMLLYKCTLFGCRKSFPQLYKLMEHYSYVHHMSLEEVQGIIPKECINEVHCGEPDSLTSFTQPDSLPSLPRISNPQQHKQSKHSIKFKLPKKKLHMCTCTWCNAPFRLACDLETHVKQKHISSKDNAHLSNLESGSKDSKWEPKGWTDKSDEVSSSGNEFSLSPFKRFEERKQLQDSDVPVLLQCDLKPFRTISSCGEFIPTPLDSSSSPSNITTSGVNISGTEMVNSLLKSTISTLNEVRAQATTEHIPTQQVEVDKTCILTSTVVSNPRSKRGGPRRESASVESEYQLEQLLENVKPVGFESSFIKFLQGYVKPLGFEASFIKFLQTFHDVRQGGRSSGGHSCRGSRKVVIWPKQGESRQRPLQAPRRGHSVSPMQGFGAIPLHMWRLGPKAHGHPVLHPLENRRSSYEEVIVIPGKVSGQVKGLRLVLDRRLLQHTQLKVKQLLSLKPVVILERLQDRQMFCTAESTW